MNFFELLFIIGWVACGIVGSLLLRPHWGSVGTAFGFVVGIVFPFVAFQVINRFIEKWVPEFPLCQCRSSEHNDYEFEGWNKNEDGSISGGIYLCRQCGRRYIKTPRRFQQVMPDGSFYPYMMHRPFGRWKQDSQESPQKTVSI